MGDQGTSAWDYEDWQEALAAAFLSRQGAPVVFFVDDDELDRLCGSDHGHGARLLLSAVRSVVDLTRGEDMFKELTRRWQEWKHHGVATSPPPTLPLLAVTVLAATRMRRDHQAWQSNYYLRMAEALCEDAPATQVFHVKDCLGAAFKRDVTPAWEGLRDWMDEWAGLYGVPTIRQSLSYAALLAAARFCSSRVAGEG